MASTLWSTTWDYTVSSARKFNEVELPNKTSRLESRPLHQSKQCNILWMWQPRPQKDGIPPPQIRPQNSCCQGQRTVMRWDQNPCFNKSMKRVKVSPRTLRPREQSYPVRVQGNQWCESPLLDSRSKGVLLSPKLIWAMGIKTFFLETPIVLQLEFIGSHSTINYGMDSKIKFDHT